MWNFLKQKISKKKLCGKCGQSFTCVVEEGCWCDKLTISKENLAKIRRMYLDCLCPKCLAEFVDPINSERSTS